MNHYFNSNESLKHDKKEIEYVYNFTKFNFITDAGVFSKDGVDAATDILLKNLRGLSGKILDLGCGYGCAGIVLAKIYGDYVDVTMSDINGRAVKLAEENAKKNDVRVKIVKSDKFADIPGSFDAIILNPPIHAGKSVIYEIYEESYRHLNANGRFFIVIQKKHGAQSHSRKLEAIFGTGNSFAAYSKKGFFVFESKKL